MESSNVGGGGGDDGGRSQQQLQLVSCTNERRDSANLRDLLKVKDDANNGPKPSGLTLGAALNDKRNSPLTLYDIIRDDTKDKNSWKHFKDKICLRRGGSAWTSTVPIPASDVPMQPNNYSSSNSNNRMMMMRRPSSGLNVGEQDQTAPAPVNGGEIRVRPELSTLPSSRSMVRMTSTRGAHLDAREGNATAAEEEEVAEGEEGDGETTGEAAAQRGEAGEGNGRMSLMALLAETESSFMMDDEEEEEEESGGGGEEYNNCCVCMVRHKGAAFIPCGHTFCRLCSRELWVQRGNCPLCNNFILEILDIF